jgi:hypothetical protein
MRVDTALTIYNLYINPSTRAEEYTRHEIAEAHWESRKASNVLATGGQSEADQARIFIPLSSLIYYVTPVSWKLLPNKAVYWTVQIGDVIVKGNVSDVINSGFTITTLKKTYDNVLIVSSVDPMLYGSEIMQHLQIGAR